MKLSGQEVLVCDCAGTMTIDGAKLGKACGAAGGCTVATSLCRDQIDQYEAALDTSGGASLIVACTQEAPVFTSVAEGLGKSVPDFVNIREFAGWSEDKGTLPKMAALLRMATESGTAARSLTLTSNGRCLIYADGARGNGVGAAMELAGALKDSLGVTVMITNAGDDIMASGDSGMLTRGTIRKASGHFTAFDLVIDGFASASPSSRSFVTFDEPQDDIESGCDLIIDITGGTPLFTGWEKRDGYLRADAEDSLRLKGLAAEAAEMIGDFEKPIYVDYDADLCAHSRNSLNGCSRCLDVCRLPTCSASRSRPCSTIISRPVARHRACCLRMKRTARR